METKHIYYSLITALVIVGLYHLFAVGRFNYPEFKLKAGQVSDAELIAPFDFPILKSEERLQQEKNETIASLKKPHRISEDKLFDANALLDDFFLVVHDTQAMNAEQLNFALTEKGFKINPQNLGPLLTRNRADALYTRLGQELDKLYRKGIYESIRGDSVLFVSGDELKEVPKNSFNSLEEARQKLQSAFNGTEYKDIVIELSPILVNANLILDDAMLTRISEDATRQIQDTEGMVLQNEVIIRKNARITEADMVKLNSLQAAYRNREISRSPLQQLMLSLGLLLFNFIIILVANTYYAFIERKSTNRFMDCLPLNLGFVLIVILSLSNNMLLGYSNLIIPFAMVALSAAILVGVDFGIFYSLSTLFVISPFINWETYTPVVLVMTTILTLILMIRFNVFHNYLSIWLYLLLSGAVVNISLGIYKNDPLMTVLSTTGYSFISSSISVAGILLIVPYYEKKWHRATRQTLLELLDFNHPLLKKLATEAVGTYHHSLIVGNLTERAAEAIGANPLLARVGSYYHDIGKVINTDIFTENNEDSDEIHDDIEPEDSAKLIKGHVLEGIEMARRYKMPQPVIDIIMQHHGTSHIRYFLEQAKRENRQVDSTVFQYPGPRPQTKEAALVMMADIIESTTKAKNIKSVEDIDAIVEQTVQRLIRENQFDEAPITLKEIFMAKTVMVPILESIYRKRLDYPDSPADETAN